MKINKKMERAKTIKNGNVNLERIDTFETPPHYQALLDSVNSMIEKDKNTDARREYLEKKKEVLGKIVALDEEINKYDLIKMSEFTSTSDKEIAFEAKVCCRLKREMLINELNKINK